MIQLVVHGTPAPQGSKKPLGKGFDGKFKMEESSPKVAPWREAVKWAYLTTYQQPRPRISGPVLLEVTFSLKAPKRRKYKYPATVPDLSKLVRSTEDALTQVGAWEDDSRVVAELIRKVYAGSDCRDALEVPGAVIRIRSAA